MNKTIKLTIVFVLTLIVNTTAQNEKLSIREILKADDAVALKERINVENINECINYGEVSYNLLSLSIKYKKQNCFDMLLKEGANPERSCGTKSPLLYAAKYGELTMLKALIKAGANPKQKNIQGRTALDYAKKYGQKEITTYLESL